MGTQYRKHSLTYYCFALILIELLARCVPASNTGVTALPSSPPTVEFTQAPELLCRSATQIRLTPRIVGTWPLNTLATWALTATGDDTILSQGTFSPEMAPLFAGFPNGKTLSPGEYRLTLNLNETTLAQHTFSISAAAPSIDRLELTLSPAGPAISRLEPGTQHLYLRYVYQGACEGAPVWVTVKYKEQPVCAVNVTLDEASGMRSVSCYRQNGAPFENGAYHAELSLMGEAIAELAFEIGEAPITPTAPPAATPTFPPTPTPLPTRCEPLYTAAGVTTDGAPFLPKDTFEWYSQAIYVGSHCEHLAPHTQWAAQWYRNGELKRTSQGTWEGNTAGVVWDSITGIPEAPFLSPGTYTVTLTIANTQELTTAFRILYYPAQSTATP